MKTTHLLILASLIFGHVAPSFAQGKTTGELNFEAAMTAQGLIDQIVPAAAPNAPETERKDIVAKAAVLIANLSPEARLLVIEQLLSKLPEAKTKYDKDFAMDTNISTVIALCGVVALIAAHEVKSPGGLAVGLGSLVTAALMKMYMVRPEAVAAHVQQMRRDLEDLRDAQSLELKAKILR